MTSICKNTFRAVCILTLSLSLSQSVWSKTFKSKFIRLELPKNWSCQQEELDYSCQPDNINERNEAIVVIATKPVDAVDDTFEKYEEYLNTPKRMRDLLKKPYMSVVKYTNRKTIRNHEWIDSLQVGSEIPGFYSRYLVSTKDKVAGLISYHIAESVYAKWAEPLNNMVESAEIFFDPVAFAELTKTQSGPLFNTAKGSQYFDIGLENEKKEREPADEEGGANDKLYAGIFVGLMLLWYGYMKMKKKA